MSYDEPPPQTDYAPPGSSRRPQGRAGFRRAPTPGPGRAPDLGAYLEVKDRIALFYEKYPDGRITAEIVPFDQVGSVGSILEKIEYPEVPVSGQPGKTKIEPYARGRVVMLARIYRTPDDPMPCTGHSGMLMPGTTPYTRNSEIENAETSAWGRALAAAGIGITSSIATRDEVRNARGEVDEELAADEAFRAAQGQDTAQDASGASEGKENTTEVSPEQSDAWPDHTPRAMSTPDFARRIKGAGMLTARVVSVREELHPESEKVQDLTDEQRAELWVALGGRG